MLFIQRSICGQTLMLWFISEMFDSTTPNLSNNMFMELGLCSDHTRTPKCFHSTG